MTTYTPQGVCARSIDLDLNDDGTIEDVAFVGGCNGNLKAISTLIKGKDAREIADILKGNTCANRPTSCADQLARAIYTELGESHLAK